MDGGNDVMCIACGQSLFARMILIVRFDPRRFSVGVNARGDGVIVLNIAMSRQLYLQSG